MALFRTGLYVKNHSVEKVQVAKTPIASYNGNVTGLYIPELIAYIEAKQSGSGTPAPDNIRPFIGVSECNVVRCGKNVWPYGDVSGTQRKAITVDIKAGTYTISANVTSSDTDYDYNLILFYYEDNTTESVYIDRGTRQSVNVTLSKNVKSINFYASRGNNVSVGDTFSFTDIQLEIGSTATAYEAYTADTYTIQLGDTYYGGSLNVTTGVLIVDSVKTLLKDLPNQWTKLQSGTGAFYIARSLLPYAIDYDNRNNTKSNVYSYSKSGTQPNYSMRISDALYIVDDRWADVTEWQDYIDNNDIYIVYLLATPITVQLTPMQVEQLLGANNVWADTGDVEAKFYNVVR